MILICEILKSLFNLFIQSKDLSIDELETCKKIMLILKKLLSCNNEKYKENLER
jgi:hypothetical protein